MQINSIQNYNQKNTNFTHLTISEEGLKRMSQRLDKNTFESYVKQLTYLHGFPLKLSDIMRNIDVLAYYNFDRKYEYLSKDKIRDCAGEVINDFIKAIDAKEEADTLKPKDKIPEREDYTFKIWPQPESYECTYKETNNTFYGMGLKNKNIKKITSDSITDSAKLGQYNNINTFYYEFLPRGITIKNRFLLPQTKKDLFNIVRGVILSHLYSVIDNNLEELNEQEKSKSDEEQRKQLGKLANRLA